METQIYFWQIELFSPPTPKNKFNIFMATDYGF